MPTWGPEARPAAVSVAFAGLRTDAPGHDVTPALPTLLRVLSDRGLYATFFVEPELAAQEPFALEMIGLSANEAALLADTEATAEQAAAFDAAGAPLAGALVSPSADTPATAAALRTAGAGYVASGPADAAAPVPGRIASSPPPARAADGLVRIAATREEAADPAVFHRAFQAAVGATLPRGELLALAVPAHRFERRDALAVLAESLDLVAGLQRAERLWTPTFAQLAAQVPAAG